MQVRPSPREAQSQPRPYRGSAPMGIGEPSPSAHRLRWKHRPAIGRPETTAAVSTLIAADHFTLVSVARYTSPIPPSLSWSAIS